MQTLAQAHGPAAHGTWLLLMAVPCLLPVPGVGTVLGLGMAALAAAMWRGQSSACRKGCRLIQMPFSAMSWAVGSSMRCPCSTTRTPASMACRTALGV
jgi:hypothetical protein